MAQCEKTLASGERCSNQAIPGTRYCQTHRQRISFRRTTIDNASMADTTDIERMDTAPLPPLTNTTEPSPTPAATKSRAKTTQQHWQASPSAAGAKPAFPGLQADERDILVAPQSIIWLQAEAGETAASQFKRLVRLMSFLSQAFPLPGQVKVLRQTEGEIYVLHLTPDISHAANLSVFYDKASDATRLVNGRLYIGQDKAFVQYRDDGAPRGYDVSGFKAPGNSSELLLVAHWGSQYFSLSKFTEVSLRDLCLQAAPLPATTDQAWKLVYALVPPALYPVLAKYFHAHHLSYRLARLQASAGTLMLFEIGPRPDAPVGQVLPAFILDYLSRLPRVVLLVQVNQAGERAILLQWKHRYPLHIPHVADAFAANELLLLVADYYPNLSITPAPQFFAGDGLADVHLPCTRALRLTPLSDDAPAVLKLEVLQRPDDGPTPPIGALILTSQELGWLRQLLYLLPGDAFSDYKLYQGEELSVLIGNSRPVEGLPFGMPLRHPGNRVLFIPLRSRFVPDLPWSLLQEALALKEGVYTFLTPDYRLDLSESQFAPLSRVMVAEPNRPRVNVRMLAPSMLPTLTWTPLVEVPPEVVPDVTKKDQSLGSKILSAIRGPAATPSQTSTRGPAMMPPQTPAGRSAGTPPQPSTSRSVPVEGPVVPTPQNAKFDEATFWRAKAKACEDAKDFLAAAVCYNFFNDVANSARCYRQAVAQLSTKEHEGK